MLYIIHELDVDGRPIEGSVLEQRVTDDEHEGDATTVALELHRGYQLLGYNVRLMRVLRPTTVFQDVDQLSTIW